MNRYPILHIDETEEEIRARRALRAEQTKQRLAQKEHHLQIQEQKIAMLKAKREKEEAEKKAKKIEKVLSLYYVKKTAKTIAYLASITGSLILSLRFLAQYNPDAREYYFIIINRLNSALSSVLRGTTGAVRKLGEVITQVRNFIRRDRAHSDSSFRLRKIRHSDLRHHDLIAPLLAGITFKTTILPILTAALKAGVTAGVAGGISAGIIGPIINRIKGYGWALLSGKAQGSFQESIIGKIKKDMGLLISVFRTKDPAVAQKLMGGLTKFNAVT